ncbi:hypothetical protein CLOM_g15279 [Closterium sp. NIES-68]|nr:hypothetical protein CLOM_g15279 [Closterium sp. NIES-68]GJP81616.1 hypothetical protein CLOP_g11759 [Closterium sp. NIES-67]GJP86972.1 hypothetical protein CLOP_g16946 [Closterium sp. NIES-67]
MAFVTMVRKRPSSAISASLVTLLLHALAVTPGLADPIPAARAASSIELAFPFVPSSSAPQFTPDTLPDIPSSPQPTIPTVPDPPAVPSAPAAPSDPTGPSLPGPSSPNSPIPKPANPSAPAGPGTAEPAVPAAPVPRPNAPALPSPSGPAPGPVTPGTACPASDLDGYSFSAPLIPDQFLLHWRLGASSLDIAVEARLSSQVDNGWMGVGWSPNGAMSPSDAVIGNLEGGAIRAFSLGGYTADSVNATDHIRLGDKGSTSTASGSTVFWFSRSQGDGGLVPIQQSGPNFIIWAYSRDMFQTLGYHSTHRGVARVDFSCNTAPEVLMGEGSPGDDEEGAFTPDNPSGLSPYDPLGGAGNSNSTGGCNSSGGQTGAGDGSSKRGNQPGGALRKMWNALFPSFG